MGTHGQMCIQQPYTYVDHVSLNGLAAFSVDLLSSIIKYQQKHWTLGPMLRTQTYLGQPYWVAVGSISGRDSRARLLQYSTLDSCNKLCSRSE